ncbi:hypothetical protein [Brucella sp. 10RB9215]
MKHVFRDLAIHPWM